MKRYSSDFLKKIIDNKQELYLKSVTYLYIKFVISCTKSSYEAILSGMCPPFSVTVSFLLQLFFL